MAKPDFIDYKEVAWKDMSVYFQGVPVTKIRDVKYKVSQENEPLHAAGDEPISIQSGNRTYDAVIKVLKGALDDINRAAVASNGRDITDLVFDIVVNYQAAPGRPIQTDTLIGCKVKEFEKAMSQGAKFMEIDLPINFVRIKST